MLLEDRGGVPPVAKNLLMPLPEKIPPVVSPPQKLHFPCTK